MRNIPNTQVTAASRQFRFSHLTKQIAGANESQSITPRITTGFAKEARSSRALQAPPLKSCRHLREMNPLPRVSASSLRILTRPHSKVSLGETTRNGDLFAFNYPFSGMLITGITFLQKWFEFIFLIYVRNIACILLNRCFKSIALNFMHKLVLQVEEKIN